MHKKPWLWHFNTYLLYLAAECSLLPSIVRLPLIAAQGCSFEILLLGNSLTTSVGIGQYNLRCMSATDIYFLRATIQASRSMSDPNKFSHRTQDKASLLRACTDRPKATTCH